MTSWPRHPGLLPIVVGGLLLCFSVGAHAQAPDPFRTTVEVPPPTSRFEALAEHLEGADSEARLDFVRIALAQMLGEHDDALAKLHYARPKDDKARAKLRRWSHATRAYFNTLEAALQSLDSVTSLEIHHNRDGVTQMVLDGRPILVSSLNIDDPQALDRRIAETFCARNACDFLNETGNAGAGAESTAANAADRSAGWSFSDGSAVSFVTEDGLHFMFGDIKDRARKERACLAIAEELRALLERLADAEHRGYQIDWGALRVDSSHRPERVTVNEAGAFLTLSLPMLGQAKGLLATAVPWLRSALAGRPLPLHVPQADLFFR